MRSLEFNMSKLLLWIQLSNILLKLFTQKGIRYIVSALGNPLYMDCIIVNQQTVAYAKVRVEVEASMDIPWSIKVKLNDGTMISMMVEIPWLLVKCFHSGIFIIDDKGCPKKQVGPSNHAKV